MTGKRFNPRDRSTKVGVAVGTASVALGTLATVAPQLAQTVLPINPTASVILAALGIVSGGFLTAMRGR